MKTVTLADTGEHVTLTEPPVPTGRDGYHWGGVLRRFTGFQVVGCWGRDGWDLGHWPYIVFATNTLWDDPIGPVYGYATYVEGDVKEHWYRNIHVRTMAISQEAWWYWCTGQSDGPPELKLRPPDPFEAIAGLCEPYRGRWAA